MHRSRVHNVLLLAIGLLVCTAAASVTLVSIAQTQNEVDKGSTMEPLAHDAALSPREPEQQGSKTASDAAADPESEQTDDNASATKEPVRTITITGRALDERDGGRPNTVITLREADGTSHSATSDRSGTFRFENIADGQQVVLSVGIESEPKVDLAIDLKGETRVFWRTPGPKTKSGK